MKKNIVMIGIMLVLALVLIRGTKIQSVDEYYLTHMEDIQEDSETVTISIKCDTLRQPENWEKLNKQLKDEKYVPNDGVILPETTYVLRKGDTAASTTKFPWNTTVRTRTSTVRCLSAALIMSRTIPVENCPAGCIR